MSESESSLSFFSNIYGSDQLEELFRIFGWFVFSWFSRSPQKNINESRGRTFSIWSPKKTPSKSKTLDRQVAKDLRGRPMFLGEAKELLKVWRVEKVAWETEKETFYRLKDATKRLCENHLRFVWHVRQMSKKRCWMFVLPSKFMNLW